MSLTVKQQKFADEYIANGNATQAAIIAGYSKKYARQNTQKLLQNTTVKKYLAERMEEISSAKIMKADEILRTLTSIGRGEIPETTVVTLKKPTTVVVDGAKESYEKVTYIDVAEVFESPTKNSDRVRALELLGKRHMLWTDNVNLTSSDIHIVIGGDDDAD